MKKIIFLIVFLTLQLFATTKYEEIYALYKSGEFETALDQFIDLAEDENDYDAAYILGYMYEHGEGTKVDMKESQKWYKFSSRGYYWQGKSDPSRAIQKEEKKLLTSIEYSEDKETMETVRQYAESKYTFKAHHANYFLPVSYRSGGAYPETNGHEALNIETEFQLSIKYDFSANLLGVNEIYTMAYTQLSFWQLYADSAYFRETNYNPELFLTIPVAHVHGFEYFKAVRFGFEHKSNGRGGDEERSWNYLTARLYFQTGPLFIELQGWKEVGSLRYNLSLMTYMGYGQAKLMFPYKKHLVKLISRNPFSDKRATELNYSYPISDENNLFVYVKGFTGYGESLIDFDNKLNKIGIGLSISR